MLERVGWTKVDVGSRMWSVRVATFSTKRPCGGTGPCRWLMLDESSAELLTTCPGAPADLAICQSASVAGGLELTGWIDC